jgi:prevent-host-death family protein
MENDMQSMSMAHAKAHLSDLLNTVESGGEVVITRHGRPVARVIPVSPVKQLIPAWQKSSTLLLGELRDAE